jgi:hypothetical protein
LTDNRSGAEKVRKGPHSSDIASPRTEVKHNLEPEFSQDAGAQPRATGLDYWLGSKEGRKRLFIIFWVVSIGMMVLGYGLMLWMAAHGGL